MAEPIHKDTRHFICTPVEILHAQEPLREHDNYAPIPEKDKIRLVAVSDTHSHPDWTSRVPPGDVFIHCGDLTRAGTYAQLIKVYSEIKALPHRHKIIVAGNHDLGLDPCFVDRHRDELQRLGTGIDRDTCRRLRRLWKSREASAAGIHFLEHEYVTITIDGKTLHFFGSPYTPEFFDWAFMYPIKQDIWQSNPQESGLIMPPMPKRMPKDKLICITHGPAKGILDSVVGIGPVGCPFLNRVIREMQPDVHFFGHIHEGARQGLVEQMNEDKSRTLCVNAALLNEQYQLAYRPSVIDL